MDSPRARMHVIISLVECMRVQASKVQGEQPHQQVSVQSPARKQGVADCVMRAVHLWTARGTYQKINVG